MRGNGLAWAQRVVIFLMISVVATFFIGAMVPLKKPQDNKPPVEPDPTQPAGTSPAPAGPNKTKSGNDKPGVPRVKISDMETWPAKKPINPDRMLDYRPPKPVKLPAALGKTLDPYWNQKLTWEPCGEHQCATVKVPLDWENPGKAALDIRVRKVPAANRVGAIFVNPGGPGIGGQDFAVTLAKRGWTGYDMIGWDPRGTGESTTVKCGTFEQTEAYNRIDRSKQDPASLKKLEDGARAFAKQCRDHSGDLLDHLSTIENVRDLDLIRALLGEKKLNYVGVSYGTFVGAVYAHLFPERVGRMVLDSAVDIAQDEEVSQADGFELALKNFATWCSTRDDCAFGKTDQKGVIRGVEQLLAKASQHPPTVGSRPVMAHMMVTGIALFLYADAQAYPALNYALQEALLGQPKTLLEASDTLSGREPGSYDTMAFAFPATGCADWADEGITQGLVEFNKVVKRSPIFAKYSGPSFECAVWTAKSAPALKLVAKDSPPIVVVGSTGDSATPYRYAQTMAKQLDNAVLVTLDGPGHGAVTSSSACVRGAISDYLIKGKVPKDGLTCKP